MSPRQSFCVGERNMQIYYTGIPLVTIISKKIKPFLRWLYPSYDIVQLEKRAEIGYKYSKICEDIQHIFYTISIFKIGYHFYT